MNESKVREIVDRVIDASWKYDDQGRRTGLDKTRMTDALIRALVEQGCEPQNEAGETAAEPEDIIYALRARIKELEDQRNLAAQDWAEDDTAIRELCRPYTDVDGNSFAVPDVVEVVEKTVARIVTLEAQLARPKECNDIECYYDYPHNAH